MLFNSSPLSYDRLADRLFVSLPSPQHRKGTILQIYRSTFIWLYNREIQENSGVFVLRNRQITSAAAKTKATTDYSKQNPIFNVQTAQPALVGRGPRDRLIDTHVVVVKGINKGMIGTVKDVNADKVRVELQSGNKMIVVPRSSLRKKECVSPLFCLSCLL